MLGIFSSNLPIQWLLILRCTLNVGITFTNLNVLCNTYPSQCRRLEFILAKKLKYPWLYIMHEMDQNQNGAIRNINLKYNTHIQGLAYIFIMILNIVKIVNEKFFAILTFGFYASSSMTISLDGMMSTPRWFIMF